MTEDPTSDADDYQDFTEKTALYLEQVVSEVQCPNCDHKFTDLRQQHNNWIFYCVLGLVGEVGELAEKLKKHLRGGGDLRDLVGDEGVLKETGDAGWYYARIAKHFGFKLSAVFRANKDKLLSRLARGVLHGEGDNR